jgi:hypothetical protein
VSRFWRYVLQLIKATLIWLGIYHALVIVIIVIFDADSLFSAVWRIMIHYPSRL